MRWKGEDLTVEVLFSQAGLATQILVRAGEIQILFDAGNGVVRDLLQAGGLPQTLAGVFLIHGHADHVAGLYGLLGFLRAEGHDRPFRVWYPAWCCEAEAILSAFRSCHHGSIPYPLETRGLADGQVVWIGETEVLARRVEHWHSARGRLLAPAPALGYRLTFRGQSVAISGDTAPCPALEDLVRGADLALIEATLDESAPPEQRAHLHLTRAAAEELSRLARQVWFIHTPPRSGRGWNGPGDRHHPPAPSWH